MFSFNLYLGERKRSASCKRYVERHKNIHVLAEEYVSSNFDLGMGRNKYIHEFFTAKQIYSWRLH